MPETGASLEGVLRALFGGDSGEGRPALLDFLTAAVRAQNLAFFVVHKRQNLVEEFLAFLAEELVVGHVNLHNFRWVTGHSRPRGRAVQSADPVTIFPERRDGDFAWG